MNTEEAENFIVIDEEEYLIEDTVESVPPQ